MYYNVIKIWENGKEERLHTAISRTDAEDVVIAYLEEYLSIVMPEQKGYNKGCVNACRKELQDYDCLNNYVFPLSGFSIKVILSEN